MTLASGTPETIHASCVVIGEAGLLIRGASDAGKSSLARELIFHAAQAGRFSRLVSDDRTRVQALHGRVVAWPVDSITGCIEVRGIGILRRPFEPAAVIRLIVDLSDEPERYPEELEAWTDLCGVMVPRLHMRTGAFSADIALGRLSGVCDTVVTL
jgi:HPr kinase/phosphorylase